MKTCPKFGRVLAKTANACPRIPAATVSLVVANVRHPHKASNKFWYGIASLPQHAMPHPRMFALQQGSTIRGGLIPPRPDSAALERTVL